MAKEVKSQHSTDVHFQNEVQSQYRKGVYFNIGVKSQQKKDVHFQKEFKTQLREHVYLPKDLKTQPRKGISFQKEKNHFFQKTHSLTKRGLKSLLERH